LLNAFFRSSLSIAILYHSAQRHDRHHLKDGEGHKVLPGPPQHHVDPEPSEKGAEVAQDEYAEGGLEDEPDNRG
jgi:hypothetical protein